MSALRSDWTSPFDVLRAKWKEVPLGPGRVDTSNLAQLSDEALWRCWREAWHDSVVADFAHRGWYFCLYRDIFRGKRVVDVGSGLGIDALTFAEAGAQVTCIDVAESNLTVVRRLCKYRQIPGVDFLHLKDLESLSELADDFDVVWCNGSMHHAPFEVVREEAQALLQHLRPNGRWIELGYPMARWARDGEMPFDQWGEKTDGGAPWAEWYDVEKVMARLAPRRFEVVLNLRFHNDDYIWFDLLRAA